MDEFEREGLKLLKEPDNRHMSFFRAILPSIQEFSDRETLRFQSKVIQIIDEMRYGQTSSYVSGPSTSHQPSYGYQKQIFKVHTFLIIIIQLHLQKHLKQVKKLNTIFLICNYWMISLLNNV